MAKAITTGPMVSDIAQEIIDAAELEKPFLWEPKHPQYIGDVLYLTQKQWDAVCEAFPVWDREKWYARPQLVWGIPVRLLPPGGVVKMSDGRALIHSKHLDELYIIDASCTEFTEIKDY